MMCHVIRYVVLANCDASPTFDYSSNGGYLFLYLQCMRGGVVQTAASTANVPTAASTAIVPTAASTANVVCVCVRVGECARACVCGMCCVRGSAMCVVCVPVWRVCVRARPCQCQGRRDVHTSKCTRQGLYTHLLAKQEDGQKAKGQRVHLAFKLFYSHAHVRARAYTRTHTHTHRTLAINAKVKLTFLNKGWDDNNPPSFHFSADEIGYWEVDPPACWRASWHACRHVACLHVAARLLVHVHKYIGMHVACLASHCLVRQ